MPMCKGKEQSNSILYPQPADRDLLYTVYCILGAGGDQVCCLHVPGAECWVAGIVVCRSVAAMAMLWPVATVKVGRCHYKL